MIQIYFPLQKGILHENQIATLGQRIADKLPPPTGTNVFKSVGMALFDLVTAKTIYETRID